MSDGRGGWERWAPLGAPAFLLCLLVGVIVLGEAPPSSKAPVEEIAAYFADHRGALLFNSYLAVFGAFTLYPWFLAGLWTTTRRAEGGSGFFSLVALVGGIALLGPLLLQAAGWGAAALEAGPRREASVAAGFMDLGNMGFLLLPMPAAVLVAATTLASRAGDVLPAWLVRAGLPLAAVLGVGGLVGFAPQFTFLLLALWLLAVAAVLLRSELRRPRATAGGRLEPG